MFEFIHAVVYCANLEIYRRNFEHGGSPGKLPAENCFERRPSFANLAHSQVEISPCKIDTSICG